MKRWQKKKETNKKGNYTRKTVTEELTEVLDEIVETPAEEKKKVKPSSLSMRVIF